MSQPILQIEDVVKHFPVSTGWFKQKAWVRAVDGVSFTVDEGTTLGVVGESGCGKSTLARLILRLIPVTSGHVFFEGTELTALTNADMREFRQHLQIVFQDPHASLDPRMTVESIISEPLRIFDQGSRAEQRMRVFELMDLVGLNTSFAKRYPHEFSGGQRQRIGVARALALNPSVIICDEPVSALDVSIQSQILNLLEDLQKQLGLTYLVIAHDLAVVRHISDEVAVMYLGRIVEKASSEALYANPRHPYTKALLSAVPIPDPQVERQRQRIILEGTPPSPRELFHGCPFYSRCPIREPDCEYTPAALALVAEDHFAACHLTDKVAGMS